MHDTQREVHKFVVNFVGYGCMGQADEMFWQHRKFVGAYAEDESREFFCTVKKYSPEATIKHYIGGVRV